MVICFIHRQSAIISPTEHYLSWYQLTKARSSHAGVMHFVRLTLTASPEASLFELNDEREFIEVLSSSTDEGQRKVKQISRAWRGQQLSFEHFALRNPIYWSKINTSKTNWHIKYERPTRTRPHSCLRRISSEWCARTSLSTIPESRSSSENSSSAASTIKPRTRDSETSTRNGAIWRTALSWRTDRRANQGDLDSWLSKNATWSMRLWKIGERVSDNPARDKGRSFSCENGDCMDQQWWTFTIKSSQNIRTKFEDTTFKLIF